VILLDGTNQAKAVSGTPAQLVQLPLTTLSPSDQKLWRALVGSRDIWTPVATGSTTHPFFERIIAVHEAPCSQFDTLRDLLGEGMKLTGPVACLAWTGRRFHGQRGRSWYVEAGNLHCCAAVPVDLPASTCGLALTMLPAVAAVDAIRQASEGALQPRIKWVNDLFLGLRKVAGVLTVTQTLRERLEYALFGIGINIRVAPPVPVTPFVPAVTCLNQEPGGGHLKLPEVFRALLTALADRCLNLRDSGPEPLFDAYRSASLVLGRRVRIWREDVNEPADRASWPPPFAEGIVEDITPDLSLHLSGYREPVTKGRLALADACSPQE